MSVLTTRGTQRVAAPAAGSAVPAVRLDRVTLRYPGDLGRPPVLADVDLTVQDGEFVCLVGASGCGKSTLLSLVAGLEAPTAGTVTVPGGRAALVFQEAALFPWLTAGENVELALRLRGVPRRDRRGQAEQLLDRVHLAGQQRTRVHELSGGMRMRVALARALAQDTRVLLMDEPFAALDAITRDVLHAELAGLWRRTGLTVLFVTHNVREAVRLGQRVLLMSSRPGRLVREWEVAGAGGRDGAVGPDPAALTEQITDALRQQILVHAVEAG